MATNPSAAEAQAGSKSFRQGTHRLIAPGETLSRVMPFMAEMGITRIANVTGLDRVGIPVVMVVRPNSRSVSVSQGKGLDLAAAKASGLMESVETWHAERIELPTVYGPLSDLDDQLPFVAIDRLSRPRGSRFSPRQRLLWVRGEDLLSGGERWVPYEMVHTDYSHARHPGQGSFHASTNGLASGNHRLEALCHAICEVIERDAMTLWHCRPRARRDASRLALETVDDADCQGVLAQFAAAGLRTLVWDATSDLGVATFYCLVVERAGQHGHIGAGAGSHPSRKVALLRALTEAAQTRLTYVSGARDDLLAEEFTAAGLAEKHQAVESLIGDEAARRDFQDVPSNAADTFEADLDWLLARLTDCGIEEVVHLDLSKARYPVAVSRVVIPGLEAPHDDDSYQPGPRAEAARADRL